MKFGRSMMVAWLLVGAGVPALMAKASSALFDKGFASYMAANCTEAMDPLFQSSQSEAATKDRALLYLAHCQSIFGRGLDAAYNLDQIKTKGLLKEDMKLYKELKAKHRADSETNNKLYFNLTPYAGQGSASPKTVKADASFYGFSLGVSRPSWSVSAFYEGYEQKMTPTTMSKFSQTMIGTQLGYFILPSWRVSGSYTNIHGNSDQLDQVNAYGVQTDYYFTPTLSLFLEYYGSQYLYNKNTLKAELPISASQYVVGVGFPIYNATSFGFNGAASYTGISLTKSSDANVSTEDNLKSDPSRFEVVLSSYFASATAGITYWSGKEVLGIRSRGAVVMDSTDLHKGGTKFSLGYTINKYVGLGASYGMETYTAKDSDLKTYRDFQSSTVTGLVSLNW